MNGNFIFVCSLSNNNNVKIIYFAGSETFQNITVHLRKYLHVFLVNEIWIDLKRLFLLRRVYRVSYPC